MASRALDSMAPRRQAHVPMRDPAHSRFKLTWEEVGFLCEGFAFASTPLRLATNAVTRDHDLGPRGAWIVMLIGSGTRYPLDIARIFRVGRSLVTAELVRLSDAGLISTRAGEADRRRSELALTAKGRDALALIRGELTDLVAERLAAYSHDEIMLCARMLRDMRVAPAEGGATV